MQLFFCLSLSVRHTSTAVCAVCANKGNQPERELEAEAKQALRASLYIQSILKRNLHT